MVYGHLGLLGPHAARNVGEEHLQEQDHVMQEFQAVEEKLVQEIVTKIKPAMHNAALFLGDGAHGGLGASVLVIAVPVESHEANLAPTPNLNVVELVQLEHPIRPTHVALTIAGRILVTP